MPWRLKGRDKFSTPQKKPTKSTKSTKSLWATDGAPSTMGSRTLKCANIFTPRTSNHCPSARWLFSKCGRCSGAIYSQYNMGNLLSLSREGDITSSRKGIVDNLSMTYDGCRLVSVSDSAQAPSVTGLADFRDGVSEVVEYTYDRTGNGEHVVGRNREIGGGTNGMEIARPGSSLMTVRPLYSFRSYYSL